MAADRALRERMAIEFLAAEAGVLLRLVLRRLGNRHAEKLAATSELLCAMAIAEEPIIFRFSNAGPARRDVEGPDGAGV